MLIGVGLVIIGKARGKDCRGQAQLRVAVSAEIAPAVRAAAARWVDGGAAIGELCAAVQVSEVPPADVAGAIAAEHGVILDSLGPPNGTVAVPDVWIPDSSTWLARVAASVPDFPASGPPVASSPVVLAMPEPVARRFGWPRNPLAWRTVVNQLNDTDPLTMGVVEPSRDAASLAGLLSLVKAGGDADGGDPAAARAIRSLSHGRADDRPTLLAELAKGANDPDPDVAAAPVGEHTVISYNRAAPAVPLAALYAEPLARVLDYPYTVLPGVDPVREQAAAGLRGVLAQPAFVAALAKGGLRGPDGRFGPQAATPTAAPDQLSVGAAPSAASAVSGQQAAIDAALATWTAVTVPTRMLMVFDMSGSMLQKVPSAGNATRVALTSAAARRGLSLFDDSSALGVWQFATELDGARPYRQVLPTEPLDDNQRAKVTAAISALRPKLGGGTGLYATTLAAYVAARDSWQPGRANAVVVFTDGRNEDRNGPELAAVLDRLRAARDAARPVQMIMIGIGRDADPDPMRKITEATDGAVFVTDDPAKAGDIFLRAMAQRGHLLRGN